MPTFTLGGTESKTFPALSGKPTTYSPGESFECYDFLADSDLTKTADTPLKNKTAAQTLFTLQSDVDDAGAIHALQSTTEWVVIHTITGTCTVRPQNKTAEPMLFVSTSDSVIPILDVKNDWPCNQLHLVGSGTCIIWEQKGE